METQLLKARSDLNFHAISKTNNEKKRKGSIRHTGTLVGWSACNNPA
jgi:hypothetical protein